MSQTNVDQSPAAPPIRTFQLDLGGIGNVGNSVNLFRGEVDLPLPLASLPGRNGLDVNVAAMYSGSVQQQVNTWNQTAPTGILGLGWSLPFEMITVVGKTTTAPEDGQFYLVANGAPALMVRTSAQAGGPWSYALPQFRFWQITRYFTELAQGTQDYWEVIKEDGLIYQYGGTPDADGNQTAIQWGVYWEEVNWLGAATAGSPSNYPLAWNLRQIRDSWGNRITFAYENNEVSLTSECSYTQECYLSSITDMFGRRVVFTYEPKTAQEYAAPNPAGAGYQDTYETKYLDHFRLYSELGNPLLTVRFGYDIADYSNNGQGTSGGVCEKRYLRSVTQVNPDGSFLPGLRFDYVAPGPDPQGVENNYGALERIHYPQGATATYSYQSQPLPTSNLQATVPAFSITNGQPGAWQGDGYVVLTDCGSNGISVVIETWNGAWVEPYTMSISGDFSPENVAVVTAANFCAVYAYDSNAQEFELNLFYMDPRMPGQWLTQGFTAPLTAPSDGAALELMMAAGNNFVVVGASSSATYYYYQYVFQAGANAAAVNWTQQSSSPSGGNALALAATGNYAFCATVGSTSSEIVFSLSSTSDLGGWSFTSVGAPVSCSAASPVFLAAADSFAVASYVISNSPPGYDVQVFDWTSEFGEPAGTVLNESALALPSESTPFSIAPVVSASSLVGSGPNVWRFDGEQWRSYTLSCSGSSPAFTYGSDIAVCTEDDLQRVSAAQFTPEADWSAIDLAWDAGGPSVSGSFATVGNSIYTLDASNAWGASFETLNPGELTSGSVQNFAPSYIASQSSGAATIALLQNGGVQQTQTIYGQSVYVPPTSSSPPPYPGQTAFAGPTAVATYAGADIGSTDDLSVYCILNGAVQTVPAVYQVTQLIIDDGYTKTTTGYLYNNDTACYDPAGQIAQYPNVIVYLVEGVAAPPTFTAPANCALYTFLNSMPSESITVADSLGADYTVPSNYIPAAECVGIVNGMLASIDVYDEQGGLKATTVNDWYGVYYSPTAPGVAAFPGLYVLLVRTRQTLDGVLQLKVYEYDPNTGLPSATSTYNYNSEGTPEKHVERNVYWYEKYDPAMTLHLLNPVIQTTTATRANDVTTITSVSVTTWKDWHDPSNCPQSSAGSKWAPVQTYARQTQPTHDGAFPDAAWCVASQLGADDWLLTSVVTQRADDSTPLEVIDVEGVLHTFIYGGFGGKCEYPTAVFYNAGTSECSYLGFESYERDQGWRYEPAQLTVTDAHTGEACLRLTASPAAPGLSRNWRLTPSGGNQTYVLSFWAKTAAGSVVGEAAYWEIRPPHGSPVRVAVGDTQSSWRYFSQVIDLGVVNMPMFEIELAAYGVSEDVEVLIDDVRFSPFVCGSTASVYDPNYGYRTARMGMNGDTMRAVYDAFQRRIASVGPAENVTGVAAPYLSLQGGEAFSVADPNSNLTLMAAGGGVYDDFGLGQWQALWEGEDEAWSVADGLLTHAAGQTDALTLKGSDDYADYGIRLRVVPLGPVSVPSGLAFGPDVLVRCVEWGALQMWELSVGGAVKASVTLPPQTGGVSPAAQDWLAFAVGDSLLFYVDGRQVFAESLGTPIRGPLGFFTAGAVGYQNALVFLSPAAEMTYGDGAGRTVQQQQLEWGNAAPGVNCIAAQSFADPRDPAGRQAVTTKSVRYPATLFGYRPELASDSAIWTGGPMTGYVASQYPADEGYPFARIAFEPSPLARPVEKSAPGQAYAIRDSSTPHTIRCSYGGGASSLYPEPADAKRPFHYSTRELTDQDGNVTFRVRDMLGRTTSSGAVIPGTIPGSDTYQQTLYVYDAAGNVIIVAPPNAEGSLATTWNTIMVYNFLGRMIWCVTPDIGAISYVYDRAGRLRFMQDANGAAAGYFLYKKYDVLGRLIEDGLVHGAWHQGMLESIAYNDNTQPAPPDFAPVWRKRIAYDGDGTDASSHLVGRVWKLFTNEGSGDGPADVTEELSYDLEGDITADTLTVAAYGADGYGISYEYDNLRRVTCITYEAAGDPQSPPAQVTYRYNGLGQVVAVGDPMLAADSYAAYTYDADGLVAATLLNGRGAQILTLPYAYNSPGWLTSAGSSDIGGGVGFAERLSYEGFYDGSIGEATRTCSASDDFEYQYAYDALDQLTQATNTEESAYSVGPITYDLNGNITGTTAGGAALTYAYPAAGNALQNVSAAGAPLTSYTYDANGNALTSTQASGGGLSLTYDEVTGMATQIDVAGGSSPLSVQLSYGAKNERVLKNVGGGDTLKLYVRGPSALPLVERSKVGGAEQTPVMYVYGPSGLLAFKSDQLYFVVNDHEGSTRLVLDGGGAVVAGYDYLPFGGLAQSYGPQTGLLNYLYTGQEFDPETGLYNYRARLYDPSIGRFWQPDPARQYASPYVYVGDDPVMNVDLTGLSSTKAEEIGFGILFGLLAIAGVALTIVSGGADVPALMVIAGGILGGAATGAGVNSTVYIATHSQDFNIKQWGEQVGIGAAGGAVAGGVAGGLVVGAQVAEAEAEGIVVSATTGRAAIPAFSFDNFAASIFIGGVSGAAGGTTSQLVSNAIQGAAWDKNFATAALYGLATGMGEGLISAGVGGAAQRISQGFSASRVIPFDATVAEPPPGIARLSGTGFLHGTLVQALNYLFIQFQNNSTPSGAAPSGQF